MRVAALAMGLFCAAFVVHWLLWRVYLPRRQTAALLAIFFACLPIGLAATAVGPLARLVSPLGGCDLLQVGLFHVAMTLAYVVAYSAIEERSPSMTLLLYVADATERGRTRDELCDLLRSMEPIERRLNAMLRDKMIVEADGQYRLTAKGRAWCAVFGFNLRLLNRRAGG